MTCKECDAVMHLDSTGVYACISCGYTYVEKGFQSLGHNNADLMKRPIGKYEAKVVADIIATNDAREKLQSTEDSINPNHYTSFAIAPNEYITANKLEWEVGNVVKYVSRYHLKNGKEDLLKAIKYIELLIERKYDES